MNLKKRIKKNEEFKEIIDLHKLIRAKSCNIYFKKYTEETRFGISVSKKIGNAVIRNRIKRRIKGILKDLNVKSNIEFILIAKKEINDMNYQELKYDLENSINKI